MSVSHVWYVVQLSIAVQLATQRFVVQTIMYCCLSWSCGLLGSPGMSSLESFWSFQEAGKGAICRWYTGLDVQDDCFGTRLSPQQDAGAGTRGASGLSLMPAECWEATGFKQGLHGARGA